MENGSSGFHPTDTRPPGRTDLAQSRVANPLMSVDGGASSLHVTPNWLRDGGCGPLASAYIVPFGPAAQSFKASVLVMTGECTHPAVPTVLPDGVWHAYSTIVPADAAGVASDSRIAAKSMTSIVSQARMRGKLPRRAQNCNSKVCFTP